MSNPWVQTVMKTSLSQAECVKQIVDYSLKNDKDIQISKKDKDGNITVTIEA